MAVAAYLAVVQVALELIATYINRFVELRLGAGAAPLPYEETDFAAATRFAERVLEEYRPIALGLLARMTVNDPLFGPQIHLEAFFLEAERGITAASTNRHLAVQSANLAVTNARLSMVFREEAMVASLAADVARASAVALEHIAMIAARRATLYLRAAHHNRERALNFWQESGLEGGPFDVEVVPLEAAVQEMDLSLVISEVDDGEPLDYYFGGDEAGPSHPPGF
ncbi:hypothetical protein ACS0TY_013122 [Phlomoides rotata]